MVPEHYLWDIADAESQILIWYKKYSSRSSERQMEDVEDHLRLLKIKVHLSHRNDACVRI